MQRILVAVDFSPESEAAAETALGFARAFNAAVTLLHVHDLPTMANAIVPGGDNASETATLRSAALAKLSAFRDHLQRRDPRAVDGVIAVEIAVEAGVAADRILQFAKSGDFDLIVVGTHGLTGIKRLLVGSVAEAVIRAAPCPVVTVRQRPPDR